MRAKQHIARSRKTTLHHTTQREALLLYARRGASYRFEDAPSALQDAALEMVDLAMRRGGDEARSDSLVDASLLFSGRAFGATGRPAGYRLEVKGREDKKNNERGLVIFLLVELVALVGLAELVELVELAS